MNHQVPIVRSKVVTKNTERLRDVLGGHRGHRLLPHRQEHRDVFAAEIPERSQFSVLHNRQPLRFRGEPAPLFLPGWAREQHEVVVLVPLEKIGSTGVSSTRVPLPRGHYHGHGHGHCLLVLPFVAMATTTTQRVRGYTHRTTAQHTHTHNHTHTHTITLFPFPL